MSAVSAAAAAAPAASPSTITMQVAEVPPQEQQYSPAPEQDNTTVVQQQYTPAAAASAPVLPAPDNLQGLSASEKMQALQQVQQASRQALSKAPASSPYYANAPKTIDIRMYDQLVVAHNKLSQKLSDGNAHIGVLEAQINQCNEDLIAAFELMKQVRTSHAGTGGWRGWLRARPSASACLVCISAPGDQAGQAAACVWNKAADLTLSVCLCACLCTLCSPAADCYGVWHHQPACSGHCSCCPVWRGPSGRT
jgi:hypothetical protein